MLTENRPTVGPGDGKRLMSVRELAHYTSLSYAAARLLVVTGAIPRVRLPALRGEGEMKRIIVDRRDVDAWIDSHKEGDFR
jgi:archaeosine-15-forming tRNA-guanine transglycosylase